MQDTVLFKNGLPYYTDLTALPDSRVMRPAGTVRELWNAVLQKQTRGCAATAALATMLMRSCAERQDDGNPAAARYELQKTAKALLELPKADPLLKSAVNKMLCAVESGNDIRSIKTAAAAECDALLLENISICRSIGKNTLKVLKGIDSVMTVGEGGALTAIRYGTALSFVYAAKQSKKRFKLICCRGEGEIKHTFLTHQELCEQNTDHTIIADADIASAMQAGTAKAVVAPLDNASGGILQAAICAKHYGIPFYICAPYESVSHTLSGTTDATECMLDPKLITGFITEREIYIPKA